MSCLIRKDIAREADLKREKELDINLDLMMAPA